jgi:hypothetical protein
MIAAQGRLRPPASPLSPSPGERGPKHVVPVRPGTARTPRLDARHVRKGFACERLRAAASSIVVDEEQQLRQLRGQGN